MAGTYDIFQKLRMGCKVRCTSLPVIAAATEPANPPKLKVGGTYEVVGWNTKNGETVGAIRKIAGKDLVAIRLGPEIRNAQDGWWNVHPDHLQIVTFLPEDPDVLRLKHSRRMSESLAAMTELHDVKLLTGDGYLSDRTELTAPSAVLCAASPVFRRMLAHDMKESRSRTIDLVCTNIGAARAMINYMFHGTVEAEPQSLPDLALLADRYDLPLLLEATVERMPLAVTKDTVDLFLKTLNLLKETNASAALAFKGVTEAVRGDYDLFEGMVQSLLSC